MRNFKKLISAVTSAALTFSMAAGSMAGGLSTVSAADKTAVELVEAMGLGWNLGNALDSYNGWEVDPSPANVEKGWGNPITTEAMIKEIKKNGFNTVRVPVTWTQGSNNADYTENAEFMARVKEVVDYVIGNGMYCIINMHHDESWIQNGSNQDKFTKDWNNIATAFKDYDEHLVFEGTNECKFGSNEGQMTYNQLFVDTVRATGGNNASRLCLVPADENNTGKALSSDFSAPTDSANMVAVSVHYYEPPTFCVAGTKSTWGYSATWGEANDYTKLESDFNDLKTKFVDNGIPVIIGEYGVGNAEKYGISQSNSDHGDYNKDLDSIHKFVKAVASTAYNMDGICPVVWDDSNSGTVVYFNRNELSWWDPDIQAIFQEVATGTAQATDKAKTDRLTFNAADVLDEDGNVTIDLKPYKDLGVSVANVVVDYSIDYQGTATSYGAGLALCFNVVEPDGTIHWTCINDDTGNGMNKDGKSLTFTMPEDGTITAEDDDGEYPNCSLDMDYLNLQSWYTWDDPKTTDGVVTATVNKVTVVFDDYFYSDNVDDTPAEETPSEETPSEETPSEETPSEETPSEETPSEETPSEETPSEETPAGEGYTFALHGQYAGNGFWDDEYTVKVDKSGTYSIYCDNVGETKDGDLALFIDSDVNIYEYAVNEDSTGIKDGTLNITIDSIKVDGVEIPYTFNEGSLGTMDDGKSMRLNIYNTWTKPNVKDIDPNLTVAEGIEFTFTVKLGEEETPSEETPSEETPADVVYGDVNGDGEVDIMDVIALNKFLLGSATLEGDAKKAADVDQNDALDSTDSLNILKYVVNLVTKLPV